jgi:hypothetical protein
VNVAQTLQCATCPMVCSYETSRPYSIGPLRGRVCIACEQSLGAALGRWMLERGKELARAQQQAEQALKAAALLAAQERARAAALEAEMVPRARGRVRAA